MVHATMHRPAPLGVRFTSGGSPRATDDLLRQVVSLVLVIFAATYPLLACSKASGFEGFYAHWLAPTLSFVVVLSYFGLYEVAHTNSK